MAVARSDSRYMLRVCIQAQAGTCILGSVVSSDRYRVEMEGLVS